MKSIRYVYSFLLIVLVISISLILFFSYKTREIGKDLKFSKVYNEKINIADIEIKAYNQLYEPLLDSISNENEKTDLIQLLLTEKIVPIATQDANIGKAYHLIIKNTKTNSFVLLAIGTNGINMNGKTYASENNLLTKIQGVVEKNLPNGYF